MKGTFKFLGKIWIELSRTKKSIHRDIHIHFNISCKLIRIYKPYKTSKFHLLA